MLSQSFAVGYVGVLSFITTFFIGRKLGLEKFADYSYVLSVSYIFYIIVEGGYKTLIFRQEIKASDEKYIPDVQTLSSMALGHIIVTVSAGCISIALFADNRKTEFLAAFVLMGFFAAYGIVSSRLKGNGRFSLEALWLCGNRSAVTIGMFLGLFYGRERIAFIFLGGVLAISLGIFWPIKNRLLSLPKFVFSVGLYRNLVIFFGIDAATQIYLRSDIILLEFISGNKAEIGNYAAAARLIAGIVLLLSPLGHICFRKMRLLMGQKAFYSVVLRQSLIMASAGIISVLTVYLVSSYIVIFTFGKEFESASRILDWLAISLFFVFPNTILTQAVIAINKELWYAMAAGLGALINIIFNCILIPNYQAMGATISTILTELFLFSFLTILLLKRYKNQMEEKA
jgi:O-antigen/teichoic acid export membrane protein